MEIMDHNQKGEFSADHHQERVLNQKGCVDCKTTKTPLWRSGPAGPKSLCNACGIRYRKKSKSMLGLNRGPVKKKQKSITTATTTTTTTIDESQNSSSSSSKKGGGEISSGKEKRVSKDLRLRLMALGKEVVLLQRQRSSLKRKQRISHNHNHNHNHNNLGEVEQAAVLLMALSCGSVFA